MPNEYRNKHKGVTTLTKSKKKKHTHYTVQCHFTQQMSGANIRSVTIV